MKRLTQRIKRLRERLSNAKKSLLTPAVKRDAWRRYREDGTTPDDPDLRDLVEHLAAVEGEFAELHQPAPSREEPHDHVNA